MDKETQMVKEEKAYYVYAHTDFQSNPFYIGKGKGNRVVDGARGRSSDWYNIVYKNNGYLFSKLMDNLTASEAYELESFILKEHRWDLVNKTTKPPRLDKTNYKKAALNREKIKCKCGFEANSPGIYRHIKLCTK